MATPANAPATPVEAQSRFFARFGLTLVEAFLGRAVEAPADVDGWIALAQQVNARAAGPRTLTQVAAALARPFELHQVELKPGATTSAKDRGLALAYVDLRAYQERLDDVVGPEGWSVEYRALEGIKGVVCRLTILGHTREDVGEPSGGENPATEALAQSFKRACSAFGLGRYLYSLPRVWAPYDDKAKRFVDEAGVVRSIYEQAGIAVERDRTGRSGAGR